MKQKNLRRFTLLMISVFALFALGTGGAVAQTETGTPNATSTPTPEGDFVNSGGSNQLLCDGEGNAAENAESLVPLIRGVMTVIMGGALVGGTVQAVKNVSQQSVGLDSGRGEGGLDGAKTPIALAVLVPVIMYASEFLLGFLFNINLGCIFP